MKALLSRHFLALRHAFEFLTILPVSFGAKRSEPLSAELQGLALIWFPVVGLALGAMIYGLQSILVGPFYLQATLVVIFWIILTGGLHLDGLADSADALVGGLGDREKTLRLLKDPLSGSMAVIALVLTILLKVGCVAALISLDAAVLLLWIPMLARLSLLPLFLTTVYVRPGGLGEGMTQAFPRVLSIVVFLAFLAAVLFLQSFKVFSVVAFTLIAVVLVVRIVTVNRLGGFTGDVAGAQIEMCELALLVMLLQLAWV